MYILIVFFYSMYLVRQAKWVYYDNQRVCDTYIDVLNVIIDCRIGRSVIVF